MEPMGSYVSSQGLVSLVRTLLFSWDQSPFGPKAFPKD